MHKKNKKLKMTAATRLLEYTRRAAKQREYVNSAYSPGQATASNKPRGPVSIKSKESLRTLLKYVKKARLNQNLKLRCCQELIKIKAHCSNGQPVTRQGSVRQTLKFKYENSKNVSRFVKDRTFSSVGVDFSQRAKVVRRKKYNTLRELSNKK
jgi:hypothetical protein